MPKTYDVQQAGQIRLFDLQPSDSPIFVLNRSVKSGLMLVLALGLVSGCAGTLVSTQYPIPMLSSKLHKSDFLSYSPHQIRFSSLTAMVSPICCTY